MLAHAIPAGLSKRCTTPGAGQRSLASAEPKPNHGACRMRILRRWPLHVPSGQDVVFDGAALGLSALVLGRDDSQERSIPGCTTLWAEDLHDGKRVDALSLRSVMDWSSHPAPHGRERGGTRNVSLNSLVTRVTYSARVQPISLVSSRQGPGIVTV